MPDLTLCPGQGCPWKNRCYRFRVKAYGRQDSFGSAPFDEKTHECRSFMDIQALEPTEDQIRYRAYMLWLASGRAQDSDDNWHQARAQLEATLNDSLSPVVDP